MNLKLLFTFIGIVLVGCAPPLRSPTESSKSSSSLNSIALSRSTDACTLPSSSNVRLQSDFDHSGNGTFYVCAKRAQTEVSFLIAGLTTAKSLCVYPMIAKSSTDTRLVETPKCFTATNNKPTTLSFNNASINYLIIVDLDYTNAMNQCLSGPSACPTHSKGFVQ